MKKGFLFIILISVFTGCVKELKEPSGRTVECEFTACFEQDVKTSLDSDCNVSWSKNDTLSYYTAENGAISKCVVPFDCSSFSFTATVGEHDTYIVAAYGGTISENKDDSLTLTGAIPAVQSGLFKDAHVAVCKKPFSTDNNLSFKNATSLIEFSLARTDVKYVTFTAADNTMIHGNGKLCFTFDDKDVPTAAFDENEGGSTIRVNADGAGTFYIATIPCTIDGFYFEFFDSNDVLLGEAKTDKTLTLGVNEIVNLGEIGSKITPPAEKDLSELGPANCYIVSKSGSYKFPAVKGNSNETVGDVKGVKVLWETFGTDVTPTVGDLVRDVTFSGDSVRFTATNKKGNVLIAVYSDSGCTDGNVLWSWHIWMTDKPEYKVYNNNAGTMMDRNLGAISATKGDVGALGLQYQWGRKDPFLGSSSISSNTLAKSTIDPWPYPVASDATNGTIAYAVAHPTIFIKKNANNHDWYYKGSEDTDNTRWQTSDKTKGLYDPCPAGYRVPDGGPMEDNGIWSTAFGTSDSWTTSSNWDSSNKGMNFGATDKTLGRGTIWYPAAGDRDYYDGSLLSVGNSGGYWSCSPNNFSACGLFFSGDGDVYPIMAYFRARGQSVRCVKDSSAPEPKTYTDLSKDVTANCYIVSSQGDYKFKGTVKGNSTESVGTPTKAEVLWETFGTSTAPNVGELVKDVTFSEDYVKFTATDNKGNAVIAVKDASDNILWSWHIWMTDKPKVQVYSNSAGTMMDRNLGATSATKGDVKALGLIYQWGRKDPFLGGCQINYSSASEQQQAASTITWPKSVIAGDHLSDNNTLSYSIANPTTYIYDGSTPFDWYCTDSKNQNDHLWKNESSPYKTIYDPCPAGYRVPDGEYTGLNVWSTAFGTSSEWTTSSNWDSSNKGMNFGATDKTLGSGIIWYPAAGNRDWNDDLLNEVGYRGGYWSCTPYSSSACYLYFYLHGKVTPTNSTHRVYGQPVRCIKESSTPIVPVESVELNKSSISLTKGSTEQLTGNALPANANVKTITWSSSNSKIASVSDNGLVTAVSEGICTITAAAYNCVKAECSVKVDTYTNLSTSGTANCYIVSSQGDYKFKGTVKGNSNESVGTPATASVLWETFGTSTSPTVGELVKDVVFSEDYVKFTATDKKGNAVIAVKDASGNILWSWHIWMTEKPEDQVYNNNAGTMMDRNLGATSATPGDAGALGFYYQWGRKDPFLGSSSISSTTLAKSTIDPWPYPVASDASNGTIAYAVAHPTTFITYNEENWDWFYTGTSATDNDRWQSVKTEYDPCPAGYRVPDGGDDGVWSKAFGWSGDYSDGPYDGTKRGMDFGKDNGKESEMQLGFTSTIWYPAAGYRHGSDGSLYDVGDGGNYWSCTLIDFDAYDLFFDYDGYVDPSSNDDRAYGQSVRCVKE